MLLVMADMTLAYLFWERCCCIGYLSHLEIEMIMTESLRTEKISRALYNSIVNDPDKRERGNLTDYKVLNTLSS